MHFALHIKSSPLIKGDLLLVDAGCSLTDYYRRYNKQFQLEGNFLVNKKLFMKLCWKHKRMLLKLVSGSSASAVHNVALRILVEGLKEIGLLKGTIEEIIEKGLYKHLYMHRTGHWLGLDVHDVGAYRMGDYEVPLKNGMILTVEPGIYISDRIPVPEGQPTIAEKWKGIGIRIEDDVLVSDKKPEVLSISALKEISDLEF